MIVTLGDSIVKEHRLYPMLLTPVYKSMLWGGGRIAQQYNRANTPTPCGESWEVSTQADGQSIVCNGAFAGQTLQDVVDAFGYDLLGAKAKDAHSFPLLFKMIDARLPLSVQVHPNEETMKVTGGDSKTEMWYVLDATSDANLYAGLKADTTPAQFKQAIDEGHCADYIVKVPAATGDTLFIPGGLIHSIDAGYLIYEVQQTSNTTFRLYDWDRKDDKTGLPRELHVEQSLQAINWDFPPPSVIPADLNQPDRRIILENEFFTFGELNVTAERIIKTSDSFMVLFCASGEVTLRSSHVALTMVAGTSVLIPANDEVCVVPNDHATLLFTTL